jgi:uncharacterized protein (DUF983 family)
MPITDRPQSSRNIAAAPERPSALVGILRQLCPRCRKAKIFRRSILHWSPKMHESCDLCGLKFEREQGYFLGAMYISYGIAVALIALFTLALWLFTDLPFERLVLWGFALFLPFAAPVTFLSRVLWIYLDRAVDPDKPTG